MADGADNFSDEASNKELLEKAKNEFNREKRLVVRNLPPTTSEKDIRAFMGFNGEFPIEEVSMMKQINQAIVTLKDHCMVDDAISKLNNTELNGLIVSVIKYHSDKILCVAHLPLNLTEYQFRELATQHGSLEKCFLMRSEETGESKGYGFVEYNETIEKVGQIKYKLDGSDVKGHQVHCDALTDTSQTGISFKDLHSKCLLITDLPKDYKDSIELRELFSTLVKPVYCQIVAKEGISLGFGIIEYNEWEDAERAFKKFHKHKINDVPIRLSYCIPGKSAVHMFTRIMFKYGDTVHVNKASLLPDPVYPNPAFLKHIFFKTHCAKQPRLLVQFTDNLLHLQEGYVRNLEDRTNAKPGLLGPAPSIPMSPLMDINLQLGLLSLIVLDMREKGTYNGEVPPPLGKVKIPTEEEFQQKNEPVSLLGDPLTAQANIILRNILIPDPKPEPGLEKPEVEGVAKLLGKPVKSLNLVYLCSFGRLMAMLSDSGGLLGNRPTVPSEPSGPKPLIEGLMQAGKVAQTLLNSLGMGQQSQGNQNNPMSNPDLSNLQNLLANSNNTSNSNSAATNFMNTIQSLAMQKISQSKSGPPPLLNALFGNKSGGGDGLLGEYQGQGQGQSKQNTPVMGKGPKPLLSMNTGGDGLMPTPSNALKDEGMNNYFGNQGNYNDSGYQGGYDDSDFNDGYGDMGYGHNYGNKRGNMGPGGDKRYGGQFTSQFDGFGNQAGKNMGNSRTGPASRGNTGNNEEKDYNSIAQQAAAYAAGAAAAYKQQYEDYMAQHGYRGGYGGYDNSNYNNNNSGYGSDFGYDYSSSGGYRGDGYGGSSSGSYSTGGRSSYDSYSGYNSNSGSNDMNNSKQTYNTSSSNYNTSSNNYNTLSSDNTRMGTGSGVGSTSGGYNSSSTGYGSMTSNYSGMSGNYGNSSGGSSAGFSGTAGRYGGGWSSGYDGSMMNKNQRQWGTGGMSSTSMGPPLPPGTGPSMGGMSTPQGQKRSSMHMLPSPEPSPEGDYVGQHSQGIGGHYADSYTKRQKLSGKF